MHMVKTKHFSLDGRFLLPLLVLFLPLVGAGAAAGMRAVRPPAACDLDKQPLVLIPGGEGTAALSEDTDGLAHLYEWLQADGYVEGCNLFFAGEVSALDTRQENRLALSALLRRSFDTFQELDPDWEGHFDIIGHSFGGLIARFYLESAVYEADQRDGIHVDNLFTLGTPHGGARVPDEIYPGVLLIAGEPLFNTGDVQEFLAVAQLYSWTMDLYNNNHRQPGGTRYHLVAGDFMQQENVPLLVRLLYEPYAGAPGDIAVSVRSAGELAANPRLHERYPAVCLYRTTAMHGYSAEYGLGELLSYVRPSTIYEMFIRDAIGRRDAGCGGTAPYNYALHFPIIIK